MGIEELLKENTGVKKDYTVSRYERWEESDVQNSLIILEYGLINHKHFHDFVASVKDSLLEQGCDIQRYEPYRLFPLLDGFNGEYSWRIRIWGRCLQGDGGEYREKRDRIALKLYVQNPVKGESDKELQKLCTAVAVTVPEAYRKN